MKMPTKRSKNKIVSEELAQTANSRPANGSGTEWYDHPLPSNWRDLVVPDPHRPGPDRFRLADQGIAVWAIIGHLKALAAEFTPETITQAAVDFRVPVTAITTAIAYYLEHQAAIDTRLAINSAAAA